MSRKIILQHSVCLKKLLPDHANKPVLFDILVLLLCCYRVELFDKCPVLPNELVIVFLTDWPVPARDPEGDAQHDSVQANDGSQHDGEHTETGFEALVGVVDTLGCRFIQISPISSWKGYRKRTKIQG